jgi:transcriptional regulator with XRE-family HTH domain
MYAHPCQQVDLASNCVVSPVTIKDWESDKVIPTVESENQVLRAVEEVGVEFLNSGSPGVMRRAVVVQPNQLETKVTYRKNPRGSQAIVLRP